MVAYVVGTIYDIKDPAGFTEYRGQAGPTLEKYGGKLVMMSQSIEVGDGSWSPIAMVMFEVGPPPFESMARAKEWYNSPEYGAAKPMRLKAADTGLIFADVP